MKITVTFDTLEEFDAFRGAPTIWREVPAPAEEKKAEPVKEEKKAEVPFEEGPMPEPEPGPVPLPVPSPIPLPFPPPEPVPLPPVPVPSSETLAFVLSAAAEFTSV